MVRRGDPLHGPVALRRQFPHVDADAIAAMWETADADSSEAVVVLAEMQQDAQAAAADRMFRPTRGCTAVLPEGLSLTSSSEDTLPRLALQFEGGDDPPHLGTVLLLHGLPTLSEEGKLPQQEAAICLPSGKVLALEPLPASAGPSCFLVEEFGFHELRIRSRSDTSRLLASGSFMVTSRLGDFVDALDHFYNAFDWAWDGNWTDDLEEATITLVGAVDDHMNKLAGMFTGFMGDSTRSMLEGPRKSMENHLAKVIEGHDSQAMGQAQSAIRELLMTQNMVSLITPMLGGGGHADSQDHFHSHVLAFEKARLSAASEERRKEVQSRLCTLIDATDAYVAELQGGGGKATELANKWHGDLWPKLVLMRDNADVPIDPRVFQQLTGGCGSYLSGMMSGMFGGSRRQAGQRADAPESMSFLASDSSLSDAEAMVARWTESLVGGAIMIGSPMAQFHVSAKEEALPSVLAAMQNVMALGLGYVSQQVEKGSDNSHSNLVSILDRIRATLPLAAEQEFLSDRRRRARLKDVCRVLRGARAKGLRFSLAVNTDFEGSLKALQEHHEESWVGENLQAVWAKMVDQKMVFAFELWLHEEGKDGKEETKRLVAADFGHPHTCGRAYYVATRFFDRQFKTQQPGFILAFAEAACLKRAGFDLWDLGGACASPMMAYKPQVALEMGRSEFIQRLRGLHETIDEPLESEQERQLRCMTDPDAVRPHGGETVPTGVIFPDLQERDLWGVVTLQEDEAKQAAAKKAAAKLANDKKSLAGQKASGEKNSKDKNKGSGRAAKQNGKTKPPVDAAATEKDAPAAPVEVKNSVLSGENGCAKSEVQPSRDQTKERFLAIFQKFLAEGLPQTDAAAKAMQVLKEEVVSKA
eukprot:TRINITY_DN35591_c0_g1_i1.p1 TRINITY_DN35591_c0_g1~~TRINITY_DN35591_c0_g1_i1.p1  ORF type:complete len:871 (+),score=193.15 TRINITY_DN35591_c0_g1_i1:81-2693(+)